MPFQDFWKELICKTSLSRFDHYSIDIRIGDNHKLIYVIRWYQLSNRTFLSFGTTMTNLDHTKPEVAYTNEE